jgi:hypothetical protein
VRVPNDKKDRHSLSVIAFMWLSSLSVLIGEYTDPPFRMLISAKAAGKARADPLWLFLCHFDKQASATTERGK